MTAKQSYDATGKSTVAFFLRIILIVVCVLVSADIKAQSLPGNPYAPRLCGTWKLSQLQTHDGMQQQSPAIEFRLIVSTDGKMQQGLFPEGLVHSQWNYDVVTQSLYVDDDSTDVNYTLHVVSLRRDRLVLEAKESGERTLMYYTPLR